MDARRRQAEVGYGPHVDGVKAWRMINMVTVTRGNIPMRTLFNQEQSRTLGDLLLDFLPVCHSATENDIYLPGKGERELASTAWEAVDRWLNI